MKKIKKISIADISFTLDDDAYLSLSRYISELKSYYSEDPDGSEIITDIEARIAELILNEQVYTKVVTKQLIDSIISQLGTPEEIESESLEPGVRGVPMADSTIPRRLYRSSEGKLLGGVCSGMAQFWSVSVIWIRLLLACPLIIFIITIPFRFNNDFFLGLIWVFVVIYLVLWVSIPMAKNPRQRLEARGEKITPGSIRQNLQEGSRTPSSKKAASIMAEILAVVGRMLLFFIKFIFAVTGFAFIISALAIFIAMIVALVDPTIIGCPALMSLSELTILSSVAYAVLLLICVMIPLFVLGLALLSLAFGWKLGKIFYAVTLGLWLLLMILFSVVTLGNARYLRDKLSLIDRSGVEWSYSNKNYSKNESEILKEFLRKEDNGINNITINIGENSVEIVAWRDHTQDSTYVNHGDVIKYESRIVLKDKKAIEEAVMERERREKRVFTIEIP